MDCSSNLKVSKHYLVCFHVKEMVPRHLPFGLFAQTQKAETHFWCASTSKKRCLDTFRLECLLKHNGAYTLLCFLVKKGRCLDIFRLDCLLEHKGPRHLFVCFLVKEKVSRHLPLGGFAQTQGARVHGAAHGFFGGICGQMCKLCQIV